MVDRHNIGKRGGARGTIRYLFEGRRDHPTDKKPELIGWRGIGTCDAEQMADDFEAGQQANKNLSNPVWHLSISFNPSDAARLDSRKMLEIAEGYLQKMGMDQTQYLIVRHHDTLNNHLHLVVNRVDDNGKTISDSHNYYRSKEALKELGAEHNLTLPAGLRTEQQHPEKLHGTELARYEIRQLVEQELATATQLSDLTAALRQQGLEVRYRLNKDNEPIGISFAKDGIAVKGSELGQNYKLSSIQERLLANAERQATTITLPKSVTESEPLTVDVERTVAAAPGLQPGGEIARVVPAPQADERLAAEVLLTYYVNLRDQHGTLQQEVTRLFDECDYTGAGEAHAQASETKTQLDSYERQLTATLEGEKLLRELHEQEKLLRDRTQAKADEDRQELREQLVPAGRKALACLFEAPHRQTWDSWESYKAQVSTQGFVVLEENLKATQLRHTASGECFNLAEVQPGGPQAPSLQVQVAQELKQQAQAHRLAEHALADQLTARNFSSSEEFAERMEARGYMGRLGADGQRWLHHEASGRQFRLDDLRPNGRPVVAQVTATVASRQAELVNGRIEITADGSRSARERAATIEQRLTNAGVKVSRISTAGAEGPVTLNYQYEVKGPDLERVNQALRWVQTGKELLVREQDRGFAQPLETCPTRRGEFAQATIVLQDSSDKRAAERVARAKELLLEKKVTIHEVLEQPGGAVALLIGYHTDRTNLPALTKMLAKWEDTGTISIQETAEARQIRGAQSPAERANPVQAIDFSAKTSSERTL